MRGRLSWLLVLGLLSCGGADRLDGPPADLLLLNGKIWTVNPEQPWAEAVAVRDDLIAAVGPTAELRRLQGPDTTVVDLDQSFVVPGFNDNHVHFASAARFLEFNVMAVSSQDEFQERLRESVANLPAGEWILGGFWGAYDQWALGSAGNLGREPFTPDISAVESLTADYPLFIQKFDGSQYAANRAALELVQEELRDTRLDVRQLKASDGRLSGILEGNDVRKVFASKVPAEFSRTRRLQQSRRALAELRRYGVTSISDMSDDTQLDLYRQLREADELTVRVHFRPHLETWRELADREIRVGSGDEWIRLGAVKGHIDGIMGTSSARFFEPYDHDPSLRGRWRRLMVDEKGNFAEGKFLSFMQGADAAGLQLSIHAIGDEANHLLLNYLEELNRLNGARDRRFRLVHAQVIAPSDFPRLGQLGVVAEVQPYHLSDDMRWMEERIGAERCAGAYAFRKIQESGATLTFGTDWPGTSAAEYPINPMLALYAATSRQTTTGEPEHGWFPDQRLSIQDAIQAYTLNTAYGNFEEQLKGSIEAGKLADLTVLSKNLIDLTQARDLLDTEVLYTIVGGRIVYRR